MVRRNINDPRYPLRPQSAHRLAIYADMMSTSYMTLLNGCLFNGSSMYLTASDISAYDWSSSNKWSVVFWRNPIWRGTGSTGYDRVYFCKDSNGAGTGSFIAEHGIMFKTSGSVNKEEKMQCYIYTGSSNTYCNFIIVPPVTNTTATQSQWSCFAATFDNGTFKAYFDGVLGCTITNAGGLTQGTLDGALNNTMPSTMPRCTAPIRIGVGQFGREGAPNLLDYYFGGLDHVMFCVGTALSQTDVTNLVTGTSLSYFPKTYAQMSGTLQGYCTGFWNCDESSGNRADSTANNNPMVPSATPPTRLQNCIQLIERGPLQLALAPISYSRAPMVSTAPGLTCLQFAGSHHLEARIDGLGSWSRSADYIVAFQPTLLSTSDSIDRFLLGLYSQDVQTATANREYMFPMLLGTSGTQEPCPHFRYKANGSALAASTVNGDNRAASTSSKLTLNTNCVMTFRQLGTGSTTSYAYRFNGTPDTVDQTYSGFGANTNNPQNSQLANMGVRRRAFGIGALNYRNSDYGDQTSVPGDSVQDCVCGYMYAAAMYLYSATGGPLSTAEIASLEAPLRSALGV